MPKNSKIDYTNRDFDSIKEQLIEYAKKYYPDTFQDFNDASFGMLMLELLSLIGDELSFYLDYQASESFLDSAIEYNNVLRLARQSGFKTTLSPSSQGIQSFYIIVPANTNATGPDEDYLPILKRGSEFNSVNGNIFTLLHDVDFSDETAEVVVAEVNNTGTPTSYAVKNYGRIISGERISEEFEVGEFERFKRVYLDRQNVAEVVSVYDAQGHQYYEVDNLAQDVVFRNVSNPAAGADNVDFLEPFGVARRFTVERDESGVYLQFGHGSESSEGFSDPSDLSLDMDGRDYITKVNFDPTNIIQNNSFGVAPENTNLIITYRINSTNDANASVNTITEVRRTEFKFRDRNDLLPSRINSVIESLETTNEEPILGDVSVPTTDELRIRSKNYFSSQKRAVTLKDYESLCYAMPNNFGSIKRANAVKGDDQFGRNINIYILGENAQGYLTTVGTTLKNNLTTWLDQHRVVNDTVNIVDPFVINVGIEFDAVSEDGYNKYDVLTRAIDTVVNEFADEKKQIGEPLRISEIYNMVNEVEGVEDVSDVRIVKKNGSLYSSTRFDIDENLSADGRYLRAYDNIIFEIKFPNDDVEGNII